MPEISHVMPRRKRNLRRMVTAAIAALVVIVPGAALGAAVDSPPDDVTVLGQFGNRTAFTAPFGSIYGPGDGYVVIGGDSIADICDGAPPRETLGVSNQVGNGTWRNEIPFGGIDRKLFLYETEPGVQGGDFFAASCGAVADGGVAPEPLAWGVGVQRAEQWGLSEPFWTFTRAPLPGRYRESIQSNDVFDAEGDRYRVVATVNLRVNEDGSRDFLKLSVDVIPRN